jgi:uncharacterized protein (TIGR02301 family)
MGSSMSGVPELLREEGAVAPASPLTLRLPFASSSARAERMWGRALGSTLIAATFLGAGPEPKSSPAPAYQIKLERLAEILGALHYLRPLCGSHEEQVWRSVMQDLMEAESVPGEHRERLVANFNRGYLGFQVSHRRCTPAAELVIRRYLDEGAGIAHEIRSRFAD